MLKLKLNRDLVGHENVPMLKKSIRANMNYPTFHRMARGIWNTRTMETLARFLFANGFTAEVLRNTKFTDIFEAIDVVDIHKKPERKFAINQRVWTELGEGTVQGYIYDGGIYKVIVKYDDMTETVPEDQDWILFHYYEDEVKAIREEEELK